MTKQNRETKGFGGKMNNQPLIEFNPKLPKLSKSEKAVLKLLVEAGRLIVPVYNQQGKQIRQGNLAYHNLNKKDPSFSSPYTVEEKVKGKIVSIPYHIKYAKFLKPIADKLNQASQISENKQFARFLKIQAKALLDGSYEEAIAAGLQMKPYILDISIGPVEHFDNQLFFAKASYQAWVGVLDLAGTKKLNFYKNIALAVRRKASLSGARIENQERVRAKVDNVILFSGLMARTQFVGVNMPMNLNMVKKYGSEVTLFNQVNDLRVKEQINPTFNKIFSTGFRQGFNSEDLRRGNLRYVALHELAHSFLYYKNAPKLGDLLPSIYELTANILGLRIAGSLLLKDIITDKQLESMIVAFICRCFYLIEKGKQDKSLSNYALGGAIFINFMFKNGALKNFKGLAIANFMKIFVSLHELFDTLEYLLSSGTRKETEVFIKKYGKFNNLP